VRPWAEATVEDWDTTEFLPPDIVWAVRGPEWVRVRCRQHGDRLGQVHWWPGADRMLWVLLVGIRERYIPIEPPCWLDDDFIVLCPEHHKVTVPVDRLIEKVEEARAKQRHLIWRV
jgi:hypothetical protein